MTGESEEPRPRFVPAIFEGIAWPIARRIALPPVVPPSPLEFASVLEARRSERNLGRAPLREVANLLAFAAGARQAWGREIEKSWRLSPSAGALHPVEIFLVSTRGKSRLFRFDAIDLRLDLIHPALASPVEAFIREARAILPKANCDLLILIADPEKTESRYENSASLLWRDAGALLQTLHLSAAAYRLGFCPLGSTGDQVARSILTREARLVGVGAAAIGRIDEHRAAQR